MFTMFKSRIQYMIYPIRMFNDTNFAYFIRYLSNFEVFENISDRLDKDLNIDLDYIISL